MSQIEVKNLVKVYKVGEKKQRVLNNVTLRVHEGDFIAIMGPSGSGKSTLLYTMSGMDRMTSGDVLVNGLSLAEQSDNEMARLRLKSMGFVFQNNHLLKNLTLYDNICLPGLKAGIKSRKETLLTAEDLMKKMGILEVRDHDVQKVSGGQLQRAAICRALINSPKLIFADEPTGALDSKTSEEVMDIFTALNAEKTTIVMVTHDPKVAAKANRIIYLEDGEILRHARLPYPL